MLKAADGKPTDQQAAALAERQAGDFLTAVAGRIKEKLRWVRRAETPHAARWRLSHFLRHAREQIGDGPLFEAVRKALATVETHRNRILERWASSHSNARLEAMNGLFQAARRRFETAVRGNDARPTKPHSQRPRDKLQICHGGNRRPVSGVRPTGRRAGCTR